MASLVLSGDTSGSITVSAPAVAGSNTQTLVATTGTLAPIVSGTAVTASGTSVDFTGIPSWVKRITVLFQGVSTNGSSGILIQIGAGSVTSSGYLASGSSIASTVGSSNYTTGFGIGQTTQAAAFVRQGMASLTTAASNIWFFNGLLGQSDQGQTLTGGGTLALGGTLDRVRITTVNGTDTFDAGTINILYE